MDQFVWKETFNIGIDEVDQQHRSLLKRLNECAHKAASADEHMDVRGVLDDLKAYADTHFKREEELMLSVEFPELESHKKQHRLFREQVEQLEREAIGGERHAIANLVTLLKDWFIQHILEQDKRIGDHLLSWMQQQTH